MKIHILFCHDILVGVFKTEGENFLVKIEKIFWGLSFLEIIYVIQLSLILPFNGY